MKRILAAAALGIVTLLGIGCGPSDSAAPKKVPEAKPNADQAAVLMAQLVRMSGSGSTEEDALQNSAFFSRYGSLDPGGTPRLNRLMKVEQDLLALGRTAFPGMLATAARPETHPLLRKGLVDLAARMALEDEDVRGLLRLLEKEPVEFVRIACVEAVALQRSHRYISALMALLDTPSKVPPHIVRWGLEMSGDKNSTDLFLTHVESVLAAEEVESPLADLGIAKPDPPQDVA